jgi:hypothetical protein
MRNTADVIGGKPIAVLLHSISDVSAINPLVAFYDIHGGKREVIFQPYNQPIITRLYSMVSRNTIDTQLCAVRIYFLTAPEALPQCSQRPGFGVRLPAKGGRLQSPLGCGYRATRGSR